MSITIIKSFFNYIPYAAFALAMGTFVWRCRLTVRAQAIWAMVILAACSKFLCFESFGGDSFVPELPAVVVLGWDLFYTAALVLTAMAIPLFFWKSKTKAVVLPIVALAIAAYGIWEGVRLPRIGEMSLEYADLPEELDGYRIMHVSDIHCSCAARRWRTQAIVDMVNAEKPDLICITGDLIDGASKRRLGDIRPLADLKARDGVWASAGNHEFYYDTINWMNAFSRMGIRFLSDECVFPRKSLALGGVYDYAAVYKLHMKSPDVGKTFAAATNGEFRVLMQHQPKFAETNVAKYGVRLQLSGHTHGGIAPPIYPLVRKGNAGFLSGVYDLLGGKLVISRGAGFWPGFPVRYFTPSEISVITLHRSKKVL